MSRPDKDPRIKILMYHRVVESPPEADTSWHYVTTERFRQQIEWIDRLGYTTITFEDYHLWRRGELSLPAKPIILTFDDGYLDTFELATPILLEYGMRAVVFVMGNRSIEHAQWDGDGVEETCPLMSDDHCRTLRTYGFEIGAHTMNHNDLSRLTNREIFHEVEASKREIESVLGEEVHTFAYPYGSVDERVQTMVEMAGFSHACGVYSGSPTFGETPLDIRRIAIHQHHNRAHLILRLATPYEYVEWLYHRLKLLVTRPESEGVPIPNHSTPADPSIPHR